MILFHLKGTLWLLISFGAKTWESKQSKERVPNPPFPSIALNGNGGKKEAGYNFFSFGKNNSCGSLEDLIIVN